MNEHRHQFGLATMCEVMCIQRSGFYHWLHCPESKRAKEDQRLLALIRDSCKASGGVYGASHVFANLREVGERCGKHRVAKIMRCHQIKALRGYKTPHRIAGRRCVVSQRSL